MNLSARDLAATLKDHMDFAARAREAKAKMDATTAKTVHTEPAVPVEPPVPVEPLHTRLDRYVDRYAHRTRGMKASEIRALFAVASRPEVVSLAGGMPNIAGLPLDVVGDAIGRLIEQDGTVAMQYSSGQGDPGLRDLICDVMALEGISAHPDEDKPGVRHGLKRGGHKNQREQD